jgi:hypothetical protein
LGGSQPAFPATYNDSFMVFRKQIINPSSLRLQQQVMLFAGALT